ncbi:MAG: hypothetical protein RLY93_05125 [Sumerlaeia bacterium]
MTLHAMGKNEKQTAIDPRFAIFSLRGDTAPGQPPNVFRIAWWLDEWRRPFLSFLNTPWKRKCQNMSCKELRPPIGPLVGLLIAFLCASVARSEEDDQAALKKIFETIIVESEIDPTPIYAEMLIRKHQPAYTLDDFPIEENKLAGNERRFRQMLAERFSVNFEIEPLNQFEAVKVYLEGGLERKDQALVDEEQFAALLATGDFSQLEFEKYYEEGSKTTAILDVGPNQHHPQAVISGIGLEVPPVRQFGGFLTKPQYLQGLTGLLDSFEFISAETELGTRIVAHRHDMTLSTIEVLFDWELYPKLKHITLFGAPSIVTEEISYADYREVKKGLNLPFYVKRTRYAPSPDPPAPGAELDKVPQKISYVEEIYVTKLNVDVAHDEDTFVPDLYAGIQVYDESGDEVKQYIVPGKVEEKDIAMAQKQILAMDVETEEEVEPSRAELANSPTAGPPQSASLGEGMRLALEDRKTWTGQVTRLILLLSIPLVLISTLLAWRRKKRASSLS